MTTQTMNNFETLDLEALANVEGGGWVKCYAGTIGSALVGSAGGPEVTGEELWLVMPHSANI